MEQTVTVAYLGTEPCDQPALGFVKGQAWQPGDTRPLSAAVAALLTRGEDSPFCVVAEAPADPESPPAPDIAALASPSEEEGSAQ